jgi:hypothetical protein
MEYDQNDLDVIKDRLLRVLRVEGEGEEDTGLLVLALVELAVETAVEGLGGAVEGLSLFMTACSGAPIIAEEAENSGLWVN